jgi:nicotinamide-nucleotide amidase
MRCEVVAVGTELLLGQIVDTNSSWIGGQLALAGIDSHFQTKVGDNHARIVQALRAGLARSDAVICCGGLGPTQDDITRDAIAEVMNVPLERDEAMVDTIEAMFTARGRTFPPSNARQADKPKGADYIHQTRGTAPGLICPVGHKVVYAVPGVPHEMKDMLERAILPDLQARAGVVATIRSRTLRTWGLSESALGERLQPRIDALDARAGRGEAAPTIAFLASGIEGIKVRLTAKADDEAAALALLAAEEAEVRAELGTLVFGVDDETMEHAVGELLLAKEWTLGVAESLTGGLVASRIVDVPGASRWFRGGLVSYATEVKYDVLGVERGPVVSEEAAREMAEGARRLFGADVGLGVTGVAGPDAQEGMPVGTVFLAAALPDRTEATMVRLPGDRASVRQFSTISLLDHLRRLLLDG